LRHARARFERFFKTWKARIVLREGKRAAGERRAKKVHIIHRSPPIVAANSDRDKCENGPENVTGERGYSVRG
jgi:hypothetical protein